MFQGNFHILWGQNWPNQHLNIYDTTKLLAWQVSAWSRMHNPAKDWSLQGCEPILEQGQQWHHSLKCSLNLADWLAMLGGFGRHGGWLQGIFLLMLHEVLIHSDLPNKGLTSKRNYREVDILEMTYCTILHQHNDHVYMLSSICPEIFGAIVHLWWTLLHKSKFLQNKQMK